MHKARLLGGSFVLGRWLFVDVCQIINIYFDILLL